MNMNQLIDMIVRTVVRRAVNSGVNAGFDAMSNLGRKAPPPQQTSGQQPDPEREKLREMRQARRATRSAQSATKL